MEGRISPRFAGDIGEWSAVGWLILQGAKVFLPIGHSADVDLVADFGDDLVRVQVKTSNCSQRGRYVVTLATRGGNRSWNGLVRHFSPQRCDYLFVHVGDGRRWFIPSHAVQGGSGLLLGGPRYEAFEIERDRPLNVLAKRGIGTLAAARRDSGAVKRDGL